MNSLLGVVAAILPHLTAPRNAIRIGRDTLIAAWIGLLATISILAAAGFFLSALWLSFESHYGSLEASLWVAVILLAVTIILGVAALIVMRKATAKSPPAPAGQLPILDIAHSVGEMLSKTAKPNMSTVLGVAVAGLVVGMMTSGSSAKNRRS